MFQRSLVFVNCSFGFGWFFGGLLDHSHLSLFMVLMLDMLLESSLLWLFSEFGVVLCVSGYEYTVPVPFSFDLCGLLFCVYVCEWGLV